MIHMFTRPFTCSCSPFGVRINRLKSAGTLFLISKLALIPLCLFIICATPAWTQEGASPSSTVTVDFKDADLTNVLRLLSDQYGINIVSGEGVKGVVTVRLTDVTLESALKAIFWKSFATADFRSSVTPATKATPNRIKNNSGK